MAKLGVVAIGLVALVAGLFALSRNSDEVELAAIDSVIESEAPDTSVADAEPEEDDSAPEEADETVTTNAPATVDANVVEDDTDVSEGPQVTTDVEVAQLGEDFIRFRLGSTLETAYTGVVTEGGQVVGTTDGVLADGEFVTARVEGLEPGTEYQLQATLIGPPAVQSSMLTFRTLGGDPDPQADSETPMVELINLRVTNLQASNFQFEYLTSECANGTFIIIDQETGIEVGRNNGHPGGCTSKHLGVPGVWTAPLTPETTYVVVVSVEANGDLRGRQYGNLVTDVLEVTTPPRETPDDPQAREIAAVEFTSIEQMETDASSVRIDFSTNVCTNASFVVREVGGAEIGRHDGFPRGCSTDHSAIPGLWTDALEPDTSYVVVLSAEADGAGQGDGNTATESITVRTEVAIDASGSQVDPISILSVEPTVDAGTVRAIVTTGACATVSVTSFEQLGVQLGDPVTSTDCSESTELTGVPLATGGNTILVVSVEGDDFAPGEPNRATEMVIVTG